MRACFAPRRRRSCSPQAEELLLGDLMAEGDEPAALASLESSLQLGAVLALDPRAVEDEHDVGREDLAGPGLRLLSGGAGAGRASARRAGGGTRRELWANTRVGAPGCSGCRVG